MKFKLLNVSPKLGRFGMISDVERIPSFSLETPNVLFYTKKGCVPHLTCDVMQMISTDSLALQFPLNNIFHCCEVLEKNKISLNSFVGLPEYFSYCFGQDPVDSIPQGYHRGASATIWCTQGKVFVPKERYMEIMEAFQPDMYCALSDGDTNLKSSTKRLCNSTTITNDAFQYCYDKHSTSSKLKNIGLIAPIEGGYDKSLRERCVNHMAKFPVTGYLIDGLYTDGKTVNDIPFESVKKIVQHTTNLLPSNQLRIIHGAWNPKSVVEMVKMGVDLFDTSFPYFMTENGWALVFNYNIENLLSDEVNLYENCAIRFNDDKNSSDKPSANPEKKNSDKPLYISLHDTKYFDDLTPILNKCNCLACKNHTKSYIHHLLVTKELLAPVLLTIHNMHHYMQFFAKIREHLKKKSQNGVMTNGDISKHLNGEVSKIRI
ncbi:queuine tRNA-ribosyltransferase accessory subunit 2-like [Planococcus citri]|uniref:queuine tRNA-ribosyltransferase accessory subunit 2-like n=1 Tax=Planococcus citri TaxID=170843 RepID=UPI0031F85FAE